MQRNTAPPVFLLLSFSNDNVPNIHEIPRPAASGGFTGRRTNHNAHTQDHTGLLCSGVSAGNSTATVTIVSQYVHSSANALVGIQHPLYRPAEL